MNKTSTRKQLPELRSDSAIHDFAAKLLPRQIKEAMIIDKRNGTATQAAFYRDEKTASVYISTVRRFVNMAAPLKKTAPKSSLIVPPHLKN